MTTWHDRLEEALKARGYGWDALIPVTGKKKPSVYGWKPGARYRSGMMDGDNAAQVCNFLRINPMWLFHNKGESGLDYTDSGNVTKFVAQEPNTNYLSRDEHTLVDAYRSADETARSMLLAQASAILSLKQKRSSQS